MLEVLPVRLVQGSPLMERVREMQQRLQRLNAALVASEDADA